MTKLSAAVMFAIGLWVQRPAAPAAAADTPQSVAQSPKPCIGDCNSNGVVTVDEIVNGVKLALSATRGDACAAMDVDGDQRISIDEVIAAVDTLLQGCITSIPQEAHLRFTDVTSEAGVDYLLRLSRLPYPGSDAELFAGGAAVADVNNDGWPDLYVSRLDAPGLLFLNRGNGRFEDVTWSVGLAAFSIGSNGCVWGDIDNDGDVDLFVSTLGQSAFRYYLFINQLAESSRLEFREQGQERGAALLGARRNGASAVFADYDRDGWLDLYVADWNPRAAGTPPDRPSYARLLHNRGADAPGFFEDATSTAGVDLGGLPPRNGRTQGAVPLSPRFSDLDSDGWPDLVIAADFGLSQLFWNNGDGTFSNGTADAGVGTDENGMGSAIGDYDGDGSLDWFVTSIFDPTSACDTNLCFWGRTGNRLYRNEGGRHFSDRTDEAGVRDGGWGWGAAFFDSENDGDLDLVMTNGINYGYQFEQRFHDDPMRLWRNDDGHFTDVAAMAGMAATGQGRGILTFDYDRDGDLDVFVVQNNGHPILYRNDSSSANGCLRVRPVQSQTHSPAIGARVTVVASRDGARQTREVDAGSNFLGQSEAVAHFGLGAGDAPVAEVRVRWPRSGNESVLHDVPRNQEITVEEEASTSISR
ncbi:MAG: CRTAC1 family protein [Deltaproteobacteria bacterium]|nr:CRTAC1 family protein [Deltaproteobacteria bacterium]